MNKANLVFKQTEEAQYAHLIQKGVTSRVARMLYDRGIVTIEQAEKYLYGSIKDMYDSSLIKGIDIATNIISESINNNEKIVIYGDYDCDGVTATSILYLTLKDIGADISYRLPDRLSEGYGMSMKVIDEFFKEGVKLIITVDNGIRGNGEIEWAKSLGMKVVVTDHHTPGDELPNADAIIDLHVKDETYPFNRLAGCGVAFKLACHLFEEYGFGKEEGYKYLDIAAIGTVGDVVDLVDENRIIVKEGLNFMKSEYYNRIGILELLKCFNAEAQNLTSMDFGFKIAPALNAPGRLLEHGAKMALQLLLTEDQEEASRLASQLYSINEERKEITKTSLIKAEQYIIDENLQDDRVLVLFVPDVPEGVVGLVSGKITEKYHKPSIVFSEGHQYYKASARSPEYFNLYDGLYACRDLFVKFGGHAQAAGMSIEKNQKVLKKLRKRINEYAKGIIEEKDTIKTYNIDEVLNDDDLTMDFVEEISALEPFGMANPKPIFYIQDYTMVKKNKDGEWVHFGYMGENGEHLKLYGMASDAIGFSMVEEFEALGQPKKVSLCFTLGVNYFMGFKKLQLELLDIKQGSYIAKKKPTSLMAQLNDTIELYNKKSS